MITYLLSGENVSLARDEVTSLYRTKKIKIDDKVLCIDSKVDYIDRIAFSHFSGRLLFSCMNSNLMDAIDKFNFNRLFKSNYSVVKFGKSKNTEKKIAERIWHRISKPKIKLVGSVTTFCFIFSNDIVYCLLNPRYSDKNIHNRRSHLRPKSMPISLHPKLARCIVNLTGARKGTVVDPFCGTGGILIEANLMGLDVIGYDIDKRMIGMTNQNFKYYKVKGKVLMKDAMTLPNSKYVVTDLPYGKNTKSFDYNKLYREFMLRLGKKLKQRSVIIFPDFVDYRKICRGTGLRIVNEHDFFIHKSMTKKIVVFVND